MAHLEKKLTFGPVCCFCRRFQSGFLSELVLSQAPPPAHPDMVHDKENQLSYQNDKGNAKGRYGSPCFIQQKLKRVLDACKHRY